MAGLEPTPAGSFGAMRQKVKEEKDASQPEEDLFIKKRFEPKTRLCTSSTGALTNGLR